MSESDRRPHVVIVGGGFGGLEAAKALRRAPVRVTIVDRTNHHLFQPLLYQVATAGLSPAEIAAPIRSVLRNQLDTAVLLDEVESVDLAAKRVRLVEAGERQYDYLVLAVGAENNYFGHDDWEQFAPGLKTLDDAVEIRRRVLVAYEAAERATDPAERARLLTFVVVGGGATGVEMAGAIAELSRFVLARDFRSIDPKSTRVVLVEGGPRVLSSFPEKLSRRAAEQLEELGVEIRTGDRITRIDASGVHFDSSSLLCGTVVWGAGVRANRLCSKLGAPLDRQGRVKVEPDCSLPAHPEVFAIGDMTTLVDANGVAVPGLSPAAMQEGRLVARNIVRTLRGEPREPFRYVDKGTMATIGRSRAIAQAKGLQLSGLVAWLAWLFVHIWYLIGFRNRFVVMFSWMWSYVTFRRGARLITGHRLEPGPPQLEGLAAPKVRESVAANPSPPA